MNATLALSTMVEPSAITNMEGRVMRHYNRRFHSLIERAFFASSASTFLAGGEVFNETFGDFPQIVPTMRAAFPCSLMIMLMWSMDTR